MISGRPSVGSTLQASADTWTSSSPISCAYRWERTTNNGATWTLISGATGSSYTTGLEEDLGVKLRVRVTATNAAGSQAAYSATVGPVSLL